MSYLLSFVVGCLFFISSLNASDLDSKIGQLIIAPICSEHGDGHVEAAYHLLKERKVAGVIFMSGKSKKQIDLAETLQDQISIPLLTFQDAEWGVGMRLADVPPLPKNMTLGAVTDEKLLKAYGLELARQCRLHGVQGNFAPICDVNTNPANPVIGIRAFGDEEQEVGMRARAVFEGMREGGLLGSAKHFPGHGDTHLDSHKALPSIEQLQLPPFQALIDAGIEMVMVGHLLYPKISDVPSSLSPEIIEGILREEMGFQGVVVTDSLMMKALEGFGSLSQICEKALLAGNDLLLFATAKQEKVSWLIQEEIPRVIDYLKKVIPEDLIDKKIERINKMRYRNLPPIPKEAKGLTRDIFRAAITQVGKLQILRSPIALVRHCEDTTFEKLLLRYATVKVFPPSQLKEASQYETLLVEQVKGDPKIDLPSKAIVCLFDTPYALNHNRALIGYENHPESKEAVSDCLFGHLAPLGKLPISLCEKRGGQDGEGCSREKRQL